MASPEGADTTESDPYVERVLGRADADASGGWWVALWVVDGDRSHFIVNAPRSELGELPDASWTPVDAQALMSLEHFSAPRLLAITDISTCPVTLRWGRALPPPPWHWSGERVELQHPVCSTGSCSQRQAWRIELPPGHAKTLPLAQVLPGLAMKEPQWLALHVASTATSPHLSGLRELVVPPEWPLAVHRAYHHPLPLSAAQHFPAIHEAMLLQQAQAQQLGATLAVLHFSATGSVGYHRYARNWVAGETQRTWLGLNSAPLRRDGHLRRLLLRLYAHDRPTALHLTFRNWTPTASSSDLRALVPDSQDVGACRARLDSLDCQPACVERVAQLSRWTLDADRIARMTPAERQSDCLKSCQQQKAWPQAHLVRTHEASQQRQAQAWQLVEALTGRSAADWLREP